MKTVAINVVRLILFAVLAALALKTNANFWVVLIAVTGALLHLVIIILDYGDYKEFQVWQRINEWIKELRSSV